MNFWCSVSMRKVYETTLWDDVQFMPKESIHLEGETYASQMQSKHFGLHKIMSQAKVAWCKWVYQKRVCIVFSSSMLHHRKNIIRAVDFSLVICKKIYWGEHYYQLQDFFLKHDNLSFRWWVTNLKSNYWLGLPGIKLVTL